jgi:hypothetical protein
MEHLPAELHGPGWAVQAVQGALSRFLARTPSVGGLDHFGGTILFGERSRSAPIIGRRFGVVGTQKLAAQAVPVIGALGGAAVNYAFIDHFQEVARAHFVVRRLERRYGKDAVRAAYDRFCSETNAAA